MPPTHPLSRPSQRLQPSGSKLCVRNSRYGSKLAVKVKLNLIDPMGHNTAVAPGEVPITVYKTVGAVPAGDKATCMAVTDK